MQKVYTKPEAEKLEFNYTEQVVASGGESGGGGHQNHAWGRFCYKDPHDPNPGPKPPHPGRPW